ncbi:hypothetical protein [Streptomyces platensis]|uniref:hypothetical protein n=1 Tax=Streptomyces platensis TaxID=58346 RepID=UPI0037B380A7
MNHGFVSAASQRFRSPSLKATDRMARWPVILRQTAPIATDYEQYLLSIASYGPRNGAEVEELINRQLTLQVRYESLYGALSSASQDDLHRGEEPGDRRRAAGERTVGGAVTPVPA